MFRWPFLLSVILSLIACSVSGGTLAQFRTVFGDIEVELYDQDKPITVSNFMHYVQSGAYQNEFAHRIVPGFVIQGGGFSITNRGTTNWSIASVPNFGNITNEFGVGRKFSNTNGTIAMAKLGGDTNSASSQWFINLANNSFLDANDTNNLFVVFGHVIKGTNILTIFNNFKPWNGVTTPPQSTNLDLQYYTAPFNDLPLLHPSVVDTNLVFVDISLLQVSVRTLAGGAREISWNSVTNMTNIVEFTTNIPPTWFVLTRTNGSSSRMAVTDAAAGAQRFYRVRVQ